VCGDVDETGMVEIMTEDHVLLNVFAAVLTERSETVNERAAAAANV
jgi:DNA-directed RNA polymerase subunit L